MRLSCPSCQTEYDVPDAALTGRARTLRCVQCGYQWQSSPLTAARPEPLASLPEPPPLPISMAAPIGFEMAQQTAPVAIPEWQPRDPVRPALVPTTLEPAPAPARRIIPPPPLRDDEDDSRDRFAALVQASRHNDAEDDEPEYTTRRQPRPKTVRRRPSPILISILVLLVAAGLVWAERAHIMQAWPPSTRLFDAINRMIH